MEVGSLAATAGLQVGQEIVAVNGEPTSGWAAVNLQLVRRLGETGTLSVSVRDQGSTADSPHQLVLKDWLRGVEEPNPIAALGIRPWRPALLPVLAQLDPKGPAQAAGLQVGDRLLMLDGQPLGEWQQLVDRVQGMPGEPISLAVERDG
ncbi:Regulator of sigma-E protease RseP [compost metagenome]